MENSTNNLDTVSSISPEALKNTIKIQKQSILLTKKSLRVQEDNLTNNIMVFFVHFLRAVFLPG